MKTTASFRAQYEEPPGWAYETERDYWRREAIWWRNAAITAAAVLVGLFAQVVIFHG